MKCKLTILCCYNNIKDMRDTKNIMAEINWLFTDETSVDDAEDYIEDHTTVDGYII